MKNFINWKPVIGYEDLYEVSNFGEVKSLQYGGVVGKVQNLRVARNNKGHAFVRLTKNHKTDNYLVSHLVYEAFVGPLENGFEINHRDEDVTNNKLWNLEATTRKKNMNYGTGRFRSERGHDKPVKAKSEATGEVVARFRSMTVAAGELNVSVATISSAVKTGKAVNGLIFELDEKKSVHYPKIFELLGDNITQFYGKEDSDNDKDEDDDDGDVLALV